MGADERSIARVVRGLVIFQRVRSSKSLFTQITAERPFICMSSHIRCFLHEFLHLKSMHLLSSQLSLISLVIKHTHLCREAPGHIDIDLQPMHGCKNLGFSDHGNCTICRFHTLTVLFGRKILKKFLCTYFMFSLKKPLIFIKILLCST